MYLRRAQRRQSRLPRRHGADGLFQVRYNTDLTIEEYVQRKEWPDAVPSTCPYDPQSGDAQRLHPKHVARIADILVRLNDADPLAALALPAYRLHPLTGNRKGFCSVRASTNWRIVFRLEDGDAKDVDLTDYH